MGNPGSVLESGWSSGEGNGNLLQYSCLGNPMDRGAWWAPMNGVSKSWTQMSKYHILEKRQCMLENWFINHRRPKKFDLFDKAMATHSSTLAWKIPWTEGPGGLQSMGSLGVGHDWATSLSVFTFMHWRRKWQQPTPAFLPGESQGWGSLVGCHLWGRTESDTTEAT